MASSRVCPGPVCLKVPFSPFLTLPAPYFRWDLILQASCQAAGPADFCCLWQVRAWEAGRIHKSRDFSFFWVCFSAPSAAPGCGGFLSHGCRSSTAGFLLFEPSPWALVTHPLSLAPLLITSGETYWALFRFSAFPSHVEQIACIQSPLFEILRVLFVFCTHLNWYTSHRIVRVSPVRNYAVA